MAINKQSFRGKEVITVDGKIDQIWINEIPADKIKSYKNPQKGTVWTPTHRYSIVVDGTRINLGMGDKDGVSDRQNLQAKDNDGKYHTLTRGLEVSVEVDESEYNGAPQYNGSLGKIVVIDASGVIQAVVSPGAGKPSQGQSYKPKDMSGVEAGQSLNGAMNFIMTFGIDPSNENLLEYGKMVHKATVKVKTAYKQANPDVPEYDAGARCGLAVLTACKLVGVEQEFESGVFRIAQEILTDVLGPITEFVKAPVVATPPAAKTARAVPAKTATTKAKPVVKAPDPDPDEVVGDEYEYDTDAPF